MSISNIIALFRNGLCVAKTLLPDTHFVKQQWVNGPLQNVMYIEYAISLTQIAGIYFNITGGYFDIVEGLRKYRQMKRFLGVIDTLSLSGGTGNSGEYTILRHGASADKKAACTKMLVGFCKFNIGAGFVFLLLNTLHLHGPTHPQPLFNALVVILSNLFMVLCVMLKGILCTFSTARNSDNVADALDVSDSKWGLRERVVAAIQSGFTGMDALQVVEPSFVPAYKSKVSVLAAKQDLIAISDLLQRDAEDEALPNTQLARQLRHKAIGCTWAAVMDAVFLLLNFIAFYGYLLGTFGYFFLSEPLQLDTAFGQLMLHATFKLTQDDCFYWGFLAGDVAWTVEPALALVSNDILAVLTRETAEVGDDSKEGEEDKKSK